MAEVKGSQAVEQSHGGPSSEEENRKTDRWATGRELFGVPIIGDPPTIEDIEEDVRKRFEAKREAASADSGPWRSGRELYGVPIIGDPPGPEDFAATPEELAQMGGPHLSDTAPAPAAPSEPKDTPTTDIPTPQGDPSRPDTDTEVE
jgi:hypothetical protein